MRDLVPTILLLSVAPTITGCGVDAEVADATIEKQLRWRQTPGEIQDCHTFKLGNERHVEVNRLQVNFREGSHHVHIYRATEAVEDSVFDCFKGIDWQKWSLVVGAQTKSMDWQLPEGVTLAMEPHQQLLAQVHWINSTDEARDEQIDIAFHTTQESKEHLGVLFGVNQRINIAPGESVRTQHFCPVPEGAKLHAVMGHFHGYGYDYRMIERMPDQSDGKVLYSAPNEPAFEFQTYSPAHAVAPGAGFQYECGFRNTSDKPITWGSDLTKSQEHCNMTAYYSPAEDHHSLCLLEASKLSALKPVKPAVRAGEDFVFEVELASAEAADVTVALQSADPTVLEVPPEITIPAGETSVSFSGRSRRPAAVSVSATLNGAKITTGVLVTGLVISEVFYNSPTGASDQSQWIEIANQTGETIDLSGYSIGAGTTDFMRTRLSLPTTIQPYGCIIVGGPLSDGANGNPSFALSEDLHPDLGMGGEYAEGIGLFASPASAIAPTAHPIDVVVYNGQTSLLKGPDGQIATVWPGTVPGQALRRQTDTVWSRAAPSPNTCEVLNAH